MRKALAVLVPLVWFGSAALAETPARPLSGHTAAGVAHAPAGASAPAKAARRSRNIKARRVAVADKRQEGPRGPGTVEEALRSCLALWDPGTHMSKQEWARACKRVAERLRGTG
jgi:hypothetical protein